MENPDLEEVPKLLCAEIPPPSTPALVVFSQNDENLCAEWETLKFELGHTKFEEQNRTTKIPQ
jgi:hypothetical protein